ncbi:MAG TPA: hypothetical protein VFG46_12005 [Chryseolinea sp.]|nr:hypothetical protein [Chryseolinea sp.]
MKTTITIVFIALYGIALIRPAFPLVEYYLKTEVYLEKCANKKRPELHCNGQCILMQKMRAMNTESQDQPRPAPAKVNFEDYPIGFVEELPCVKSIACSISNPLNVSAQVMLSSAYTTAVFHPPSLSV